MAFNDAIFSYEPDKGSSFLSFAKLVVKRKVIDYIRYHQKRPNLLSLDEINEEEQMENPLVIAAAKKNTKWKQRTAKDGKKLFYSRRS